MQAMYHSTNDNLSSKSYTVMDHVLVPHKDTYAAVNAFQPGLPQARPFSTCICINISSDPDRHLACLCLLHVYLYRFGCAAVGQRVVFRCCTPLRSRDAALAQCRIRYFTDKADVHCSLARHQRTLHSLQQDGPSKALIGLVCERCFYSNIWLVLLQDGVHGGEAGRPVCSTRVGLPHGP